MTRLASESPEARKSILERQHPLYAQNKTSWDIQLDAFEGRGGFLDGTYLWPYPREAEEDFRHRKAMARYHNYLETLVDLYVRFMFTAGVRRESKSQDFNKWQEDVDGAGTSYNDLLKRLAAMALTNGHAGLLVDKTRDEASGPTLAEENARVVASVFTAASIADWRHVRNELVAVKLIEVTPTTDLVPRDDVGVGQQNYLIWDKEGWARFDAAGDLMDADTPGLGLVPLVVLRPKPSHCDSMLGRALVSNAGVIQALFNRASEEDEVLRSQAFSLLTVSVHPEGDVDQARASLGNTIGAAKAVVVKGTIDYKTPDQNVPSTIRDNIAYLVQEMYRAAHVRNQREGLQVESGDSIRLQYTELNEMLQGFAKSLAECERQVARAWFSWTTTTPEAADAAFEAAEVEVEYPDEFFLDALMSDLEAWAEALRMNLGPSMAKRIKKRAVRRIDPQISTDDLQVIDAEIDGQKDDELNPTLIPTKYEFDRGAGAEEGGDQGGGFA